MSIDRLVLFRKALDDQDIQRVGEFIRANPAFNYNAIASNGASALWWALNPPRGKEPSPELVQFLVALRKDNGEPYINPTQTFDGWTPRQYTSQTLNPIGNCIINAENNYVAHERDNVQRNNMARIAGDAQNVHDSTVVRLSRANLLRLYNHYVTESTPLDAQSVAQCETDLRAELESRQSGTQLRYFTSVLAGLEHCFRAETNFPISEKPPINLTLPQLLTLNWRAITDNSTDTLPDGLTAENSKANRMECLCASLHDTATAYGEGQPSCLGGTCIRMGQMLTASHADVHTSLPGEPLTGEAAQHAFVRFMGRQLAALATDNLETYWHVLLAQLLKSTEINNQACHVYLKDNYGRFAEELCNNELIAANVIEENLEAGSFPVAGHTLSQNLVYALWVLEQDISISDVAQLCNQHSPEEVLEEAHKRLAEKLCQTGPWKLFANDYKVAQDDHSFIVLIIKNWQYLTERHNGVMLPLGDLFPKATQENPSQALSKDASAHLKLCMLWAMFERQQEALKSKFPQLAEWLNHLTAQQIITLVSLVNEHNPTAMIQLTDNISELITCALKCGYCSHLVLDGITIQDGDFRGFDFNHVNFDNATLENCDMRLTLTNGCSCQNLSLPNTMVPFLASGNDDPDVKAECLYELCCQRGPIPMTTVTAIIEDPQSREACFKYVSTWGSSILMIAAENSHTDIINAILTSPHCTSEYIQYANNYDGETALILVARNGGTAIVQAILTSPHCTSECIQHADNNGETALIRAAKWRNINVVKILLEHPNCSLLAVQDLLKVDLSNPCFRAVKDVFAQNPMVNIVKYLEDYCQTQQPATSSMWQMPPHQHIDFIRGILNDNTPQTLQTIRGKFVNYINSFESSLKPEQTFQDMCQLLGITSEHDKKIQHINSVTR